MEIKKQHIDLRGGSLLVTDGYINRNLIDQEKSYYIESKKLKNGGSWVYQHVVMNDGTVYSLRSNTAATRGILPEICNSEKLKVSEVKKYFKDSIYY